MESLNYTGILLKAISTQILALTELTKRNDKEIEELKELIKRNDKNERIAKCHTCGHIFKFNSQENV